MTIWQASRPTVIDSEFGGRHYWIEGSDFPILEGVEEPLEASDASWLSTLHSFAPSTNLWQFSFFCSRLPFRVFTLKSRFFYFFFDCPITHSKIWGRYSRIKGSDFSILEGVEDLKKASDVVRSLPFHSSVCSTHESLKIFSLLL